MSHFLLVDTHLGIAETLFNAAGSPLANPENVSTNKEEKIKI
jgi:hypothetical protein